MSSLSAFRKSRAECALALESLRQRVVSARVARRKSIEEAAAGRPSLARAESARMNEEIRLARELAAELSTFAIDFASVHAAAVAAEGFALLAEARGVRDEPIDVPATVVSTPPVYPGTLGRVVAGTGFSPLGIEKALRDAGRDAEIPSPTAPPPCGVRGTGESPLDFDDLTLPSEVLAQIAEDDARENAATTSAVTRAIEEDDEVRAKNGGRLFPGLPAMSRAAPNARCARCLGPTSSVEELCETCGREVVR
jgi:hypothetical protein